MRTLLAAAFLSLSVLACKPPVTEIQIPQVSAMQGKGYQEVVPMTEIKLTSGTDTIQAFLVTPEMMVLGGEEKYRADGKLAEFEPIKLQTLRSDAVLCQIVLLSVSKDNADPNKWTYTLTDDTGKTSTGKVGEVQGDPKPTPGSSGGINYRQTGQLKFEGYKIGAAKKISIKFTSPGKKASTLTWVLPSDHQAVAAPANSQPASTPAQ